MGELPSEFVVRLVEDGDVGVADVVGERIAKEQKLDYRHTKEYQHRAVVAEDVIKLFADKSSELFHGDAKSR